jgi:hypothetical protein
VGGNPARNVHADGRDFTALSVRARQAWNAKRWDLKVMQSAD